MIYILAAMIAYVWVIQPIINDEVPL